MATTADDTSSELLDLVRLMSYDDSDDDIMDSSEGERKIQYIILILSGILYTIAGA